MYNGWEYFEIAKSSFTLLSSIFNICYIQSNYHSINHVKIAKIAKLTKRMIINNNPDNSNNAPNVFSLIIILGMNLFFIYT